jgi:diguanylate cyclase (GGDEF)-like protein
VDEIVQRSQTPLMIEDIATEINYRIDLDRNLLGSLAFSSLMAVPVVINENFAGVFKCYHPRPGKYQNADLRILQYAGEMQGIQLLNSLLVAETERLARTDGITGLFVQYYFVEKIREEIYRARNSGSTFSLLVIDIDRFKIFNDTYGHLAGDFVLVRTADVIRSSIRTSDFPSRYGGDEFFLILPETDQTGAEALAERIRARIFEETRDLKLGEMTIDRNVTVSIGVKQYVRTDGEWKDFVHQVDELMYRAKTTGRNKVVGPGNG